MFILNDNFLSSVLEPGIKTRSMRLHFKSEVHARISVIVNSRVCVCVFFVCTVSQSGYTRAYIMLTISFGTYLPASHDVHRRSCASHFNVYSSSFCWPLVVLVSSSIIIIRYYCRSIVNISGISSACRSHISFCCTCNWMLHLILVGLAGTHTPLSTRHAIPMPCVATSTANGHQRQQL